MQRMILGFIWITFAFTVQCYGTETIARGVGTDRDSALNDAIRRSVEQGVGTLISSTSEQNNSVMLEDKIYTSATGYVESYKVLKEQNRNGLFEVTIKAKVNHSKLADNLDALKILWQQMENPRVIVFGIRNFQHQLEQNKEPMDYAKRGLQNSFNAKGLRIFDTSAILEYRPYSQNVNKLETELREQAFKANADLMVLYELALSQNKGSGLQWAKATLKLTTKDVYSGRVIATTNHSEEAPLQFPLNTQDVREAFNTASQKAALVASKNQITQIASWMQNLVLNGKPYRILLQKFGYQELVDFKKALRQLGGYKSLSELTSSPGTVRIEYFSVRNRSELYDDFYLILNKPGFILKKNVRGREVVFSRR